MSKVFIYVEGGIVQEVRSDDEKTKVTLIDADNLKEDGLDSNDISTEWAIITKDTKEVDIL